MLQQPTPPKMEIISPQANNTTGLCFQGLNLSSAGGKHLVDNIQTEFESLSKIKPDVF
jgi:hypothetical protein